MDTPGVTNEDRLDADRAYGVLLNLDKNEIGDFFCRLCTTSFSHSTQAVSFLNFKLIMHLINVFFFRVDADASRPTAQRAFNLYRR